MLPFRVVSRLVGEYKVNLLGSPRGPRQQMEVWFYFRIGTTAVRPAHAPAEKKLHLRSSERVRRSLALLTKTYHGSRQTVHSLFTDSDFPISSLPGLRC